MPSRTLAPGDDRPRIASLIIARATKGKGGAAATGEDTDGHAIKNIIKAFGRFCVTWHARPGLRRNARSYFMREEGSSAGLLRKYYRRRGARINKIRRTEIVPDRV